MTGKCLHDEARGATVSGGHGFTLIELMVALVIGSAIMVALAGTVRIAFKARESAVAVTKDVRTRNALADVLRGDIEMAQPPSGEIANGFVGVDGTLRGFDSDELWFFAASGARDRRRLFEDEPLVDTEAVQVFRGDRPSGATDVQEVSYSLVDDPDEAESLMLMRAVRVAAIREIDEEAPAQVVARGITGFNLRYFDGTGWVEAWDATLEENKLPLAVEVVCEWRESRGGPLVLVMALPLAEVDDGTGTRVVR